MQKIAIDLGYGYVKAVSEKNRVLFPSVLAPAADNISDIGMGLGGSKKPGYYVELRETNSIKKSKMFVGELAVREGRAAQMTLARERFARDASLILSITGAYLAGADGRASLGFGIPLAYYQKQRYEVQKAIQDASMHVSVDNGPEKLITFSRVCIYPQGVGALFGNNENLPKEGLFGLIDVGYHTTDYLLFELRPDGLDPLSNYMSSVEMGVHTAHKLFADIFRQQTGKPLSLTDIQGMWNRRDITFDGRKIALEPIAAEARQVAGQAITEAVLAAWSEKVSFLDGILLAGGGAIEFLPIFQKYLGGIAQVLPEPQFANAIGFYNLMSRVAGAGKEIRQI